MHTTEVLSEPLKDDPANEKLATIAENDGSFTLSPNLGDINSKLSCWIVSRNFKASNGMQFYKLQIGDVIRFGRSIFVLIEMYVNNELFTNTLNPSETAPKIEGPKEESDYIPTCRICLCEISFDEDSPLISPCKCNGSVKYLHLECLKKWVLSLVKKKQTAEVLSLSWKSIQCEICKTPLPKAIYFKKQVIELLDITRPKFPYVMFEVLDKNTHESKGIHLINTQSTSIFKIVL